MDDASQVTLGTQSGADTDTPEFEPLTPRPDRRSTGPRRWIAAVVIAGTVAGVAVLVSNLLGDSALFFYNADEAIERRDELSSQRFRLQGTPLMEPSATFWNDRPVLAFGVMFNEALVDVVHTGDPPELFQPGVPVVLEGVWQRGPGPGPAFAEDGWHFASDRMLVKHDNDYRSRDDYDERITDAETGVSKP